MEKYGGDYILENTERRVDGFTCQMLPPVNNQALNPREAEVYDTVERFNRQMIYYMNQPEVEVENAIPSATQELGHSYYLKKKRLGERGMQMHYAKFMHDRRASSSLIMRYNFMEANKQTVCWEQQDMDYDIRYVRNGQMIGRESANKTKMHYIFRAKNAQGLYACPACGAVQPLETLLDGCDYCKAKFDINAYQDYVASVCDFRSTKYFGAKEREKMVKKNYMVAFLFSLGFGLILSPFAIASIFTEHPIAVKIFLALAFGGLCILAFLAMFILLLMVIKGREKEYKKFDEIYDAIRSCNPDFDVDVFASLMDSKIKAAYYATHKKDISAFVLCETDAFLMQNQNVISCDVNNLELLNFRTDNVYQYIDVCRQVNLLRDMGNQVVAESKYLYLTLCKKRQYKPNRDVVMYRCPNCGSSISLKTGGICEYCDSKMDYLLYDWAIVHMHYGEKPSIAVRGDAGI